MDSESGAAPGAPVPPPNDSPRPGPGLDEKRVRTWAAVAHLSALVGFVGIPFGHVLGPFLVWLLRKDDHPFLEEQAREALNFQISILIYSLAGTLMICCFCLGIPLLVLLQAFNFLSIVVAAVKAGEGRSFRYPLCIRFLKG